MMNYMEYCIIFMTSTYCLNYNYDSHVQAINNEMFFNNKILFSMLFVISAVALLPFSVIFNFSFDMLVFVSSEFEKFSDIIMEFMLFKLSAKLSEKSNNDSSSSLTLSLFLRYVEKNRWSKAIQILQTTKMALFIRDSPADEYDIQAHELWIRSCERFKYVNPAVGETVLHRAILSSCKVIATVDQQRRATSPYDIVSGGINTLDLRTLCSLFPSSLSARDRLHGRTPLHLACLNEAPSYVVHLLVEGNIMNNFDDDEIVNNVASMLDYDGRSALHYACLLRNTNGNGLDDFEHDVHNKESTIQLLLRADPSMVMIPDRFGDTPLALFWQTRYDEFNDFYVQVSKELLRFNQLSFSFNDLQLFDWNLTIMSRCAQLLLCSADPSYTWDGNDGQISRYDFSSWMQLHFLITLPNYLCPTTFLHLAIMLYEEEAQVFDHNGNLPLHIAASLDPMRMEGIIDVLIDAYPDAVSMENKKGRLPLDIALRASNYTWNTTVKSILERYPIALEKLTVTLSAGYIENIILKAIETCNVSCLFQLLLNRPEFFKNLD